MVEKVKEKKLFLSVYLRASRKKGDNRFIVVVGVNLNKERFDLSLGYYIDKCDWDEVGQRPIKRKNRPDLEQLDNIISVTLTKLRQSYDYLRGTMESVRTVDIINCFRGTDVKKKKEIGHGILEIFNKETERMRKAGNMADSTMKRRECVRRDFEEFFQKTYHKDDYLVEKVDINFIRQYETFLIGDHKQSPNTFARYIKFLKTIISYAHANGYITRNPFYGIKYHSEPVEHPFLTVNELQMILSKKIEMDRMARIKDIFCFCCLTGLAYVDVASLMREDIIENLGEYWIRKKRHKSSQIFEVPLCDVAYAIAKKYIDNPSLADDSHKLFPVSSNQKMNAYLKELADICGIQKKLTTHCARRTFATLSQAFGSKLQNIARMMGHTNVTMTQKYAQILDISILEDSNRMNGRFKYEQ